MAKKAHNLRKFTLFLQDKQNIVSGQNNIIYALVNMKIHFELKRKQLQKSNYIVLFTYIFLWPTL